MDPTNITEDDVKKMVEKMMQKFVKSKKPILPDPSLPQIPGYSHVMSGEDTHQIIKCNEEGGVDEEFQPLEISNSELKEKEFQFQNLIVEKVTRFFKNKFGTNFDRLVAIEIMDISDKGIYFEEMWRNKEGENLYLPEDKKKWDPKEFHLYIIWRSYYRLLSGKTKDREPSKMSDLTIRDEIPTEGSKLSQEGVIKREDGEIVLCLPEGCLDKLTKEATIEYLSAKSLANIKLIPTEKGLTVRAPADTMTPAAKERLEQMKASSKEKLEQTKKDIDAQYDKMVTDTKGAIAQKKEEMKNIFLELISFLKQLFKQAKEVASRMVRLPQTSIVTTSTGPGVAINAVITELDNLMALAAGLTALIEQIELRINKLELEKYSKDIEEISKIYAIITSALSMAKTAVALIGG